MNRMRTRIMMLSMAALLAMVWPAQAQFKTPDSKNLMQVKNKVMLVALVDESTRLLQEYQHKPNELKAYKEGVAKFNELIRNAATRNYKFGKGLEFKGEAEAIKIMNGKTGGKYALVKYQLHKGEVKPAKFIEFYNAEYNSELRKRSRAEGFSQLTVMMLDKDKKLETVFEASMAAAYPSEGDLHFAFQTIQRQFDKVQKGKGKYEIEDFAPEVAQYGKDLKKKTLLVDAALLGDAATEDDLRSAYPHNLQVVDFAKIDEAIKNSDSAYAYVMVVPTSLTAGTQTQTKITVQILHLVVDAGDGKVMGRARPSRMSNQSLATDVTKKEVKEYTAGH